MSSRLPYWDETRWSTPDMWLSDNTANDATIIQCAGCDNQVSVDQFSEQELRDDGWLLGPVVYCPKHGPDEGEER